MNMHSSWQNILSKEFEKPYFIQLKENIDEEYDKSTMFSSKRINF